jgi:hypothetical protein
MLLRWIAAGMDEPGPVAEAREILGRGVGHRKSGPAGKTRHLIASSDAVKARPS